MLAAMQVWWLREKIFHSMVDDFGFKPLLEHYACMVDILGGAGKMERALEFINTMRVEPDPSVWGALLGACMIHENMGLAQLASEKLFSLDPKNVGYYLLLSNIYSVEKKYTLATASVTQVVKQLNLAKTPGATFLEIGDIPCVFTAGDHSHPQKEAIYTMLEKLLGKLSEAGYKPETVTALHDVEEEEKELIVKIHSEKLAITFGLIETEPGTQIRSLRTSWSVWTATVGRSSYQRLQRGLLLSGMPVDFVTLRMEFVHAETIGEKRGEQKFLLSSRHSLMIKFW